MVRLQVSTLGLLIAVFAVLFVGVAVKQKTAENNIPVSSDPQKASYQKNAKGEVLACSTVGTDYVMIMDRSGSMKSDNRAVMAQAAAKGFIDRISSEPGARVGLVSFEDVGDETTDLNLTTNFSQAKSVIDGYVFTGMTCTRCGINLARSQYNNNARAGAAKVVILLTDGMPWHSDDWYDSTEDEEEIQNILNVARTHWQQTQMQIYAIGLGTAKFENFLPDLVAISGAKSYITTDGSQLDNFYNSILDDLTPNGGVSGSVFNDTNTNNVLNTGESKLSGWVVTLNPGGATRTTDSSGNFSYGSICDGTYTLSLTMKSGWFATGPTSVSVTVSGGNVSANRLFGVSQGYTVNGNVFIDTNRDGVKQTGEANYSGATITRSGASSGSTTTDGSGNYVFGNVTPGNYNFGINVPSGYQATTTNPAAVTVSGNTTRNFGIAPLFTITGNIFNDANRDGIKQTGEANFPGVTVNRSGASSGSTTTDANGNYTFSGLAAGSYTVSVTAPAGYMLTSTNPVNVTVNGNTTVNFAVGLLYAISGNVYLDLNEDGVKQTGEANYQGATITRTGGTSATDITDASGLYSFAGLTAGNYSVIITLPPGYLATTATSVATSVGPNRTINFGIIRSYTITGSVYRDANKNGLQDAGEPNYAGTPSIAASRGTVTTFPDGRYTITNLDSGSVTVSYSNLPAGYYLTYPLNGPPPSFQVTVGPSCGTNGARGATCQ